MPSILKKASLPDLLMATPIVAHSTNKKDQRYQSLFCPSASLAKISKMVVMNAGGNE